MNTEPLKLLRQYSVMHGTSGHWVLSCLRFDLRRFPSGSEGPGWYIISRPHPHEKGVSRQALLDRHALTGKFKTRRDAFSALIHALSSDTCE